MTYGAKYDGEITTTRGAVTSRQWIVVTAVFIYLGVWIIESEISANLHSPIQQYSESASPYVYGLCLIALTLLYAYMAYAADPVTLGAFSLVHTFPLWEWFRVPIEPIGLYRFVSVWVIALSVVALLFVSLRLVRHVRRKSNLQNVY